MSGTIHGGKSESRGSFMFNSKEIRCPHCNHENISVNWDKVLTAGLGTAAILALAIFFGLSGGGWIALSVAMTGGSSIAYGLLRWKTELAEKSSELGGLFFCENCMLEVSTMHVLNTMINNLQ